MKKICISKNWNLSSPDYENDIIVDFPNDYTVTLKRDKTAPGGASNAFIPGTFAKYTKYMKFENCDHTILDVDGAYMCARVYCNENLVDMHPHGYTPYLVDLTDAIKKDKNNKLEISVCNIQPSTRWYSGSGVYRDVFVWTGGKVRVEPWDVFVYTKSVSDDGAKIIAKIIITSDENCCADVSLSVSQINGNVDLTDKKSYMLSKGKNEQEVELHIDNPKLWSCDTPELYKLNVKIEANNKIEDEAEYTFGIKTVSVDAKNGLLINGKPMKLQGGCIHHDHGVLGSAEYPAAIKRKLKILKDAGFNAIRIAHNPPSLALLEECDRIGMFVMDEAFDMWNQPKNNFDYSLWFKDWWQKDISYMVLRDRNHPCVLSYSIGNEIIESDGNSEGYTWAKKLAAEIRKYDNTKFVTSGTTIFYWAVGDENAPQDYKDAYGERFYDRDDTAWTKLIEKYAEPLDIVGYNYMYHRYEKDKIKFPERVIWGSETKAIYFYDSWKATVENSNVIGDFTWTAYDNLGEVGCGRYEWGKEENIPLKPATFPWVTCFQGDIEISGFRRPQSYFREAIWKNITPPHIFTIHPSHNGESFAGTTWHWYDVSETWTFDDKYIGEPIQTQVYTTADEVEFYLNGKMIGCTKPVKGIAKIEIPYEKGVVSAIAKRDGKEEIEFSLATTSAPCKLVVTPEKNEIEADNRDLCYYDVFVVDADGNIVEEADNKLSCKVQGGELMGFFSGSPKTLDQFGSNKCHAYRGKAVAIIRCSNEGTPTVRVTSEGLESAVNKEVVAIRV